MSKIVEFLEAVASDLSGLNLEGISSTSKPRPRFGSYTKPAKHTPGLKGGLSVSGPLIPPEVAATVTSHAKKPASPIKPAKPAPAPAPRPTPPTNSSLPTSLSPSSLSAAQQLDAQIQAARQFLASAPYLRTHCERVMSLLERLCIEGELEIAGVDAESQPWYVACKDLSHIILGNPLIFRFKDCPARIVFGDTTPKAAVRPDQPPGVAMRATISWPGRKNVSRVRQDGWLALDMALELPTKMLDLLALRYMSAKNNRKRN